MFTTAPRLIWMNSNVIAMCPSSKPWRRNGRGMQLLEGRFPFPLELCVSYLTT